ncbi:MAG: hypothetical protein J0L92_10040 [Deltaproteobacteria bacterium]|nr:hypothetical protein [Deltaproteobacteria bacterium]
MPHRDSFDALHAHKASLELRVSELEAQLEAANARIRELEAAVAANPRPARFAPPPSAATETSRELVRVRPILADAPPDTVEGLIASIAREPAPEPSARRRKRASR